ncbi:MAG: hypothetical protein IT436_13295 [Phycisphaerales bacterium]|nr:hypothetical protein [Phycisphaerales bacterium]
MNKSRCTEEQIAFALRQAEVDTPIVEVCRKMGIPKTNRVDSGSELIGREPARGVIPHAVFKPRPAML